MHELDDALVNLTQTMKAMRDNAMTWHAVACSLADEVGLTPAEVKALYEQALNYVTAHSLD